MLREINWGQVDPTSKCVRKLDGGSGHVGEARRLAFGLMTWPPFSFWLLLLRHRHPLSAPQEADRRTLGKNWSVWQCFYLKLMLTLWRKHYLHSERHKDYMPQSTPACSYWRWGVSPGLWVAISASPAPEHTYVPLWRLWYPNMVQGGHGLARIARVWLFKGG